MGKTVRSCTLLEYFNQCDKSIMAPPTSKDKSNLTSVQSVSSRTRTRRHSRRSPSSLSEKDESTEMGTANHVNGRRGELQDSSGQQDESIAGDDDGVLERRPKKRRKKKFVYNVFYVKPSVKNNTKLSLTVQKKFVKINLAAKLTALKKESRCCFAVKVARLENLEKELSRRYASVKGLNVKHDGDQLEEQNELLELMEKTLEKVQKLLDKWQEHQKIERGNLLENVMVSDADPGTSFYPHPLCCQFCFDAKRGQQSAV